MLKPSTILSFLFLLPALLSVSAQESWAQDSREEPNAPNSKNVLNRLTVISAQLSDLNERLQSELQDSRKSSRELQTMLEASRQELEGLKSELGQLKKELELLQISSAQLLTKAQNSQTELAGLREALKKAESSLMSLEISFAAYREASEKRIKTLTKEKRLWKWGCIAAGILAAGFGAAFIAGR